MFIIKYYYFKKKSGKIIKNFYKKHTRKTKIKKQD